MLDVVQISYHETFADDNYDLLKIFAPHAKRVQGVKGIFEAHQEAARIAETSHFYVIDADAVMDEEFSFRFKPSSTKYVYENTPETNCVFVWRSRNPINDLLYGYGGAKLFPRKKLLQADNWRVDMTTTIGCPFVPKFQISNVTAFNTSPFETWKSAFRECCKLSSKTIRGQVDNESEERLRIWTTMGSDVPFGEYAIAGAIAGREFGLSSKSNLQLINDFNWLQEQFDATCK